MGLSPPQPRGAAPPNLWGALPPPVDERDAVQKKTFTKWVNAHLARAVALTCIGLSWVELHWVALG
uniref:Uncharacterized protein n=1 Tax=Amazona collaria TaxID=241587 RepID=A0A8B9FTF2_9PSIT